jgi:hypothetical protein
MQDEQPEPTPTGTDGPAIPFSFTALKPFDVETIPVSTRTFSGLVSVPPGQHPLEETLGEPCGDPVCPYRAHALELHPDPMSMLKNYAEAARAAGVPLALVLEGLTREVYRISTSTPILTADLSGHAINWRIPVTFTNLRVHPSSSLTWEVTRIIRDHYSNGALLLAPGRHRGHDLLVHADAGRELRIEYLGRLNDILPAISPTGLRADGPLLRLLRRVLGDDPGRDTDPSAI